MAPDINLFNIMSVDSCCGLIDGAEGVCPMVVGRGCG